MQHHLIVALIVALSSLAPLTGGILSIRSVWVGFAVKDRYELRGDLVMALVLLGVTCTTLKSCLRILAYPFLADQQSPEIIVWRVFFTLAPVFYHMSTLLKKRRAQNV